MDNKDINRIPEETVEADEITVSPLKDDGKRKKSGIFKSRAFKYGTLATALTAALIIVVIAANMVFSVLTDSYSWAIDLTSTGLYEISDATKQVVNSLDPDTEIEITVFYDESKYPYYMSEPIKRFCNLSDCLSYTYIDPEKNPASLTQYGSEYNIEQGAVVVTNGDRVRVFNIGDYYSYDTDTGSMDIYIEDRLAAGVLFVTKEQIPTVYFLNGHGEEGYEALMNMIANNGANVEEVNLMTDTFEMTPDSKLMVICNPTRDYSESEIRLIEDFLNNNNEFGTNLMYFSATDAVELPNLEKMLKTWGFSFNNDMVLDSTNCYTTYPYLVIPEYSGEELMNTTSKLSTVTSLLYPNTRSINVLFEENSIYKTQKLVTSADGTSYSRNNADIYNTWEKQDTDSSGVFTMSALSMKYKYISNNQVQSYVFVSGSTDMLVDQYLSYTGNGEYLMQLYKIMVNEQDDTILAARKSTSSSVITLNNTQTMAMTVVVLAVIPVIFLIIGLVVYIRRRFL